MIEGISWAREAWAWSEELLAIHHYIGLLNITTGHATLLSRRDTPGASNLLAVLDQHGKDLSRTVSLGTLSCMRRGGIVSPSAREFVIFPYLGGASRPSDWDVDAEASYWVGIELYSDSNQLDRILNGVITARLWMGIGRLSWVDILRGAYGLECGLTVSEACETGGSINAAENAFILLGAGTRRPEDKLDERDARIVRAAPTVGAVRAQKWDDDTCIWRDLHSSKCLAFVSGSSSTLI